jgi:hypothetical protein
MFALRKRSFKPILEALEDRCLLSATPLAVQSAETAIAGILQNVQQQFTSLQATVGDVIGDMILASQQAASALTGDVSSLQFNSLFSHVVLVSPQTVNPNQTAAVSIGYVLYPSYYANLGYPSQAYYRWQVPGQYNPNVPWILGRDPSNPSGSTIAFSPAQIGTTNALTPMLASPTIFPKTPGTYTLDVAVAFYLPNLPVPKGLPNLVAIDVAEGLATITISPKTGIPLIADVEQDSNDLLMTVGNLVALQGALAATADSLTTL